MVSYKLQQMQCSHHNCCSCHQQWRNQGWTWKDAGSCNIFAVSCHPYWRSIYSNRTVIYFIKAVSRFRLPIYQVWLRPLVINSCFYSWCELLLSMSQFLVPKDFSSLSVIFWIEHRRLQTFHPAELPAKHMNLSQ